MKYDSLSHVPARTRYAGIQPKSYSAKKGYTIDKGPQCRCSECRRMFYRRALNRIGWCPECVLTGGK